MKRAWIGVLAVLVAVGLSLVSCSNGKREIERLLPALPVPHGAVPLYQQAGVRQGSADACSFPYAQLLYGSEMDFREIARFYTDQLESASWTKSTGDLVSPGHLSWERNGDFWLSVEPDPRLDFPKRVVTAAQVKYKTVYFVSVTYIDFIARRWCLKAK